MKRILYSGATKTLLAALLLFSCVAAAIYGFLVLRAPVLYQNAATVYETVQYSELFSKYIERTAVYIRYLEEGYRVPSSDKSSKLKLLLEGDDCDTDLDEALFNVYEPSETAFYYYHAKLNEEPTNFLYYVKNIETGTIYASEAFAAYASSKSGSVDQFLSSGILSENMYAILNTQNNRTLVGGGDTDILSHDNLLWSIHFISHPFSDTTSDIFFFDGNLQVGEAPSNKAYLESINNSFPNFATGSDSDTAKSDNSSLPESASSPSLPKPNSYLLYAIVADNLVKDSFSTLATNFALAKKDFHDCMPYAVLFAVLSFFLFFFCNIVSGKKGDIHQIHLHFFDRIFVEFFLAVFVLLLALPVFLWDSLKTFFTAFIANYPLHSFWVPVILGCLVLYFLLLALPYFSIVRRFKAGVLLNTSFCGRFLLLPFARLLLRLFQCTKEFFSSLPSLLKTLCQLILAALWLVVSVLFLLTIPLPGCILLFLGACVCAFVCMRNMLDHNRILQVAAQMSAGNLSARIPTDSMLPSNRRLSEDINHICDGLNRAVEAQTKSERMKAELITNVSHDIKTPLTSIINYIELIKNELPQEGAIAEYAEILSQKSWRLMALIDDLVEASKASSGAIKLEPICFDAAELLRQAVGDFEERLNEQKLTLCMSLPENPVVVYADGACTHRIIENMLSNVCKYALSGTRVFLSLALPEGTGLALLTIKNTSATMLTKSPEELLTRFARGNEARSDEGSGLGLSIAESLAALQGGTFYVETDGDLFKAKLTIPLAEGCFCYTSVLP